MRVRTFVIMLSIIPLGAVAALAGRRAPGGFELGNTGSGVPAWVLYLLLFLVCAVLVLTALLLRRSRQSRSLRELQRKDENIKRRLSQREELDPITGLMNPTTFFNRVASLVRGSSTRYVLIRFDISRFKVFNDLFGLDEGNRLLATIGTLLTKQMPENSICGHLQADHFIVCFPYELLDIKRITLEITSSLNSLGYDFEFFLCFGVYVVKKPDIPIEIMSDRANIALRAAKKNYAVPFVFYCETMREELLFEQEIVGDFTDALALRQFSVYFQPVYSLSKRRIVAAEALVKWAHPRLGLLQPGRFIPLLEKTGLISRLDMYMFGEVCAFQKRRTEKGLEPLPVSVNLSRLTLYSAALSSELNRVLSLHLLPSSLIRLEVTESAYADNPTQLVSVLGELRTAGFSVMMDDFGSGYSSLNILKDVSVDYLKIDMCFIRGLETSGRAGNIITSVVRMAKWLSIPVVAEGVETKTQLDFLRSVGCDLIQGFYFSRPLPIDDFSLLLSSGCSLPDDEPPAPIDSEELDTLFNSDLLASKLFNTAVGALALYEMTGDSIEAIRVNEKYYDILGYDPQSFFTDAENVLERVHEDDRGSVLDALHRVVRERSTRRLTLRRLSCAGEYLWLDATFTYIGRRGLRNAICSSFTDITPQMHRDETIRTQSRQLASYYPYLEQLYSAVPCGIIQLKLCDSRLRLYSFNRAARELFGIVTDDDFIYAVDYGGKLSNLNNCFSSVEALVRRAFESSRSVESEDSFTLSDGRTLWLASTAKKMTVPQGDDVVQIICTDITDRKQLEAENLSDVSSAISKEKKARQRLQETSSMLRNIIMNLPVGVAIYEITSDGEPTELFISDFVRTMFGAENESEATSRLINDFLSGVVREADRHSETESDTFETELTARDLYGRPIEVRVRAVVLAEIGRRMCYAAISDITELMRDKRKAERLNELYKVVMEDALTVVFDLDVPAEVLEYSVRLPDGSRKNYRFEHSNDFLGSTARIADESRGLLLKTLDRATREKTDGVLHINGDFDDQGVSEYKLTFKSLCDGSGDVYRIVGRAKNMKNEDK